MVRSRNALPLLAAIFVINVGCNRQGQHKPASPATASRNDKGAAAATQPASRPAATRPAATRPASATAPTRLGDGSYGAPIEATIAPIAVAKVFDGASSYAGQALYVEGDVAAVCQKKGCWMTLTDGERHMRVTFKDYGFFVPKDLPGSRVRAEGVFDIKETPVDEARHYLEDAGRHDEASQITEPQRDYVFVATGVQLVP